MIGTLKENSIERKDDHNSNNNNENKSKRKRVLVELIDNRKQIYI